jgi:hypothetical protein
MKMAPGAMASFESNHKKHIPRTSVSRLNIARSVMGLGYLLCPFARFAFTHTGAPVRQIAGKRAEYSTVAGSVGSRQSSVKIRLDTPVVLRYI